MPSHHHRPVRGRGLVATGLAAALTAGAVGAAPAFADPGLPGSGTGSAGGSVSGSVSVVDDLVADAKQQVYNITDSEFVRTPLANEILGRTAAPVVVLGAQLQDDCSAPPVLEDRLDAAARLLKDHPENPAILTGGVTVEDCPSEAAVMEAGLEDRGVDNDIILEEDSWNTLQNVENTAGTIEKLGGTTIVVTSDPHYLRALKNYRDAGLRAFGYVGGVG
ncbi:MAG: YdcF family protein [Corynebacterium sp.]|uniref:YdcF family protein n=1 Tax=unclassified Corynebacterium TaxID=2624378 RepID=UPI002649AB18|nr:YdcF family protein [Corynebacterium sp.]MDN5719338.1 YdcF family protein [Corynebacterium sp.]MDN6258661.1 YdcF family protein [Corynebacterium sp.]MDN6323808.1 YdcF family protein [Corynebacterium sp.]MDN6386512.1 YdcF family protein [Corynebacterium sp.]MDN6509197.1 YdcF family protein [Corynebacterium sp.]